eukprot:3800990-Amphidinium_carterae.2
MSRPRMPHMQNTMSEKQQTRVPKEHWQLQPQLQKATTYYQTVLKAPCTHFFVCPTQAVDMTFCHIERQCQDHGMPHMQNTKHVRENNKNSTGDKASVVQYQHMQKMWLAMEQL